MAATPVVTTIVRGRFQRLEHAVCTRVAANVWSIRLQKSDPIHALTRRTPTPEAWDDAIFAVNGVEAEPAVGSGEDASSIVVTVLILA